MQAVEGACTERAQYSIQSYQIGALILTVCSVARRRLRAVVRLGLGISAMTQVHKGTSVQQVAIMKPLQRARQDSRAHSYM